MENFNKNNSSNINEFNRRDLEKDVYEIFNILEFEKVIISFDKLNVSRADNALVFRTFPIDTKKRFLDFVFNQRKNLSSPYDIYVYESGIDVKLLISPSYQYNKLEDEIKKELAIRIKGLRLEWIFFEIVKKQISENKEFSDIINDICFSEVTDNFQRAINFFLIGLNKKTPLQLVGGKFDQRAHKKLMKNIPSLRFSEQEDYQNTFKKVLEIHQNYPLKSLHLF
ncbi:hypothetical protein K8Q94_00360 [Candidatus Nomurabacteria bacterium]|nr:hypothetical protein [Candidatus Nomurabacteria bacterium]